MTRTLTVPAGLTVTPGADLWLVGEGESTVPYWPDGRSVQTLPPAEFVAAASPCETCHDEREYRYCVGPNEWTLEACPDCRIELVGPCPNDTDGDGDCWYCSKPGRHHTLGYAYAIGQPLLITEAVARPTVPTTIWVHFQGHGRRLLPGHYGDPAGLIGKWALRVRVTT